MMHFCSSLSKRYMTQDPCDSSAKSKTTGHGAYYEESYENIMPLCILCFRTRRAAINRTLVGLSTSFLYYMLSAGSQKTFNVESCALCSSKTFTKAKWLSRSSVRTNVSKFIELEASLSKRNRQLDIRSLLVEKLFENKLCLRGHKSGEVHMANWVYKGLLRYCLPAF